jgi:hypothetical protein
MILSYSNLSWQVLCQFRRHTNSRRSSLLFLVHREQELPPRLPIKEEREENYGSAVNLIYKLLS